MDKECGHLVNLKTDSISVSKTSTGKYSWDIKIYNESLIDGGQREGVIATIEEINRILSGKFQ